MIMTNPFEDYLTYPLPDYDREWKKIIVKMIITTICFLFIIPNIVATRYKLSKTPPSNESRKEQNESIDKYIASTSVTMITTTTIQGSKKRKKSRKTIVKQPETKKKDSEISTNDEVNNMPVYVLPIINVVYLFILFMCIATSPNNKATARNVFQAPLLKPSECEMIINMTIEAAKRNVLLSQEELKTAMEGENKQKLEKKLLEPAGWSKDRHKSYPTTDLNVANDFRKEDHDVLSSILNARLSPLLEKIYGIPSGSIRANDMFVVRYDGDGQKSLNKHTDSSHVSFNVLLNDGFTGGGTRFHNRRDGTYIDAMLRPGEVLINNAMVTHEGLPTTEGTRYILVGFMNIDRMNPWTGVPTKVKMYSTFLSFSWLTVLLKDHLNVGLDHRDTNVFKKIGFFAQAVNFIIDLGDLIAPHGIVQLVNEQRSEEYIDALDSFYQQHGGEVDKAKWFEGQQIHLGIDGRVDSEWRERKHIPGSFVDL
mmetsp:Transcript_25885/g.30069  ORF Transcript_25885/g.30069 Transcript_25885/m.30069 type:complete len:481 (-) Transcript_25885:185-1627(-)